MGDLIEDGDCRWMVRIAQWELEFQVEDSTFVESPLWASDVGMPNEDVVLEWPSCDSDSGDFLIFDFLQVLYQSLVRVSLILLVDGCSEQSLIS